VTARKHLRCTKCGSPFLRPSRTRIWERPLRLLLLRPYRCRECRYRLYSSMWRNGTLPKQSHVFLDRRFPAQLTHDTAAVKIGRGSKWMLVYVLLTCISIVAVASLKIGSGLQNNVSLHRTESSAVRSTAARNQESQEHEAAAFTSPASTAVPPRSAEISPIRQTNKVPTHLNANAAASVQSLEQLRSPSPHHEDVIGSSPAEAIWAQRPKIPAEIKAMITSDNVVEVQVQINAAGNVIDATALFARGPVAPSLVRYARDTARRWRFRPARKSGKPVPSDKVIEFLFRTSDS
jgi:TonB family protein